MAITTIDYNAPPDPCVTIASSAIVCTARRLQASGEAADGGAAAAAVEARLASLQLQLERQVKRVVSRES